MNLKYLEMFCNFVKEVARMTNFTVHKWLKLCTTLVRSLYTLCHTLGQMSSPWPTCPLKFTAVIHNLAI